MKLHYPFDSLERCTKSLTETGCLTIDWELWQKEQETFQIRINGEKPFKDGSEITVSEHDVFNMSDRQVDAYLDWYEKTWISSEEKERNYRSLPQDLLDMFPTGRLDGSEPILASSSAEEARVAQDAHVRKLLAMQKSLKIREVVSEGREGKQTHPVRRIGSMYECYRYANHLSPHAKSFYEVAAKLAAVSLPTLVGAVYKLELQLQKWRREELSKEAKGSTTDETIHSIQVEDV